MHEVDNDLLLRAALAAPFFASGVVKAADWSRSNSGAAARVVRAIMSCARAMPRHPPGTTRPTIARVTAWRYLMGNTWSIDTRPPPRPIRYSRIAAHDR